MKVDQNNAMPVEHMVLKFVQGLKFQIMSIVYAENLQTLDVTIITVKNVERGLIIANESK